MSLQLIADIHRASGLLTAALEGEKRIASCSSDLFALAALSESISYDVASLQTRLTVAPSTLSSILNRLEKRGLIQRRPARDRRSYDLVLTPEGHTKAEAARQFLEGLEDKMVGELSYGQVIAFTEVLEALEKILPATAPKTKVRPMAAGA